ncbi:MAG TPA: hypothetical protein VIG73_09135, partial [Cerasibacillus sp.]
IVFASVPVTFHCRRTLSLGLLEPPHSQKTLVAGSQDACFSRWSRRLPFQVTWFGQTHELGDELKSFTVANDLPGATQLRDEIVKVAESQSISQLRIGLESSFK